MMFTLVVEQGAFMQLHLNGVEIVCAGLPRSGSTLLYRAMAGLPPGDTTPKPQTGPVRKTHSPQPQLFESVRIGVFIFGDPIDAVISTRVCRWDEQHFRNCEASKEYNPNNSDVFRKDVLNYEKIFDAWMQRQNFDLAVVRYEKLYESAPALSAILGIEISLPEWRPRKDYSEITSAEDRAAAYRTYERLAEKISLSPDLAFWSSR